MILPYFPKAFIYKNDELIIEPNSTNLIKELNNYCFHDKKSETPIDNFNHLLDALGYAVWDLLVKKKGVYGIF